MSLLCVIPARSGSKRLKNKNTAPFMGRPLVCWTIDVANECHDLFDKIILSSDSDAILWHAHGFVERKHRPRDLASDSATMRDVAILSLLTEEKYRGERFDGVCILPPTAPLRTADDVRACVNAFDGPCVMAVAKYNLPPWQALHTENGEVKPLWSWETTGRKGQDWPPLFCDAGSVYVVSRDHLLQGPTLYHEDMRVYEVPIWRAADIDDADGLEYAHVLARGVRCG